MAGQHRLIDGRDLVWQRIDKRGMYRENRIEEVGEADAVCLGHEPEHRSIAIEAPGPTLLDDR